MTIYYLFKNYDHSKIKSVKDDLRIAKSIRYSREFKMLNQTFSPLTQRAITAEKEKGASSWLHLCLSDILDTHCTSKSSEMLCACNTTGIY